MSSNIGGVPSWMNALTPEQMLNAGQRIEDTLQHLYEVNQKMRASQGRDNLLRAIENSFSKIIQLKSGVTSQALVDVLSAAQQVIGLNDDIAAQQAIIDQNLNLPVDLNFTINFPAGSGINPGSFANFNFGGLTPGVSYGDATLNPDGSTTVNFTGGDTVSSYNTFLSHVASDEAVHPELVPLYQAISNNLTSAISSYNTLIGAAQNQISNDQALLASLPSSTLINQYTALYDSLTPTEQELFQELYPGVTFPIV